MSSAKTHTFIDRYDVYSFLLHTLQQCSASVLHHCWEASNQVVAKQSFAHMFCPIALPPRCAFHIRASVVSHIRAYSEHLTTVHACCLGCGRNWPGDEIRSDGPLLVCKLRNAKISEQEYALFATRLRVQGYCQQVTGQVVSRAYCLELVVQNDGSISSSQTTGSVQRHIVATFQSVGLCKAFLAKKAHKWQLIKSRGLVCIPSEIEVVRL